MYARMIHYGPWQIPVKVIDALCSDGKRRVARITAQPDTAFTIPASVKVSGKTVSGFITGCETEGHPDYEFHAVLTGKNAHLLRGDQ